MTFLEYINIFWTVIAGAWMLAVANKVIGDIWEVLFSKRFKNWLKVIFHKLPGKVLKGKSQASKKTRQPKHP